MVGREKERKVEGDWGKGRGRKVKIEEGSQRNRG